MITVPFIPAHTDHFEESPWQKDLLVSKPLRYAKELSESGLSGTIIEENKIFAIVGAVPCNDWTVQAWAIMGAETKGKMISVTREVRKLLDTYLVKYDRIETLVREDFVEGHKWAKLLGFEKEGLRRMYATQVNYVWYARVKHG